MNKRMMKSSLDIVLRLGKAIPASCALCGIDCRDGICDACDARYFQQHDSRCVQCGVAMTALTRTSSQTPQKLTQRCGDCLRQAPKFDVTIVATDYVAPVDQLVQALKFGNRLALAPLFYRMLLAAIRRTPEFAMPTLLTAVPLSATRLQTRGFNQALEIARPLAQALAIPLTPSLLARSRDTQMQALLHPDERHENIRNAFMLATNAKQLDGQHIAVVDDVMTTGETLNEIAATLKRGGAAYVTNLVFARTPPK